VIQWCDDCIPILLDREIVLQRALVDCELAAAGANPYAGNGSLAAASSQGVDYFFCRGRHLI
jgi:hypothetical protein